MNKAVERLIEAGWLEQKPSEGTGRHRVDYIVNPRVFDMEASHE